MLLGQINVITGALYAAGRPLGALLTWAWMAVPWAVGAALWMAFGKPVWLVSVLIAARVLGLLAGRLELGRAGLRVQLGLTFVRCGLAAAAIVGGAAAAADGRTELILLALAVLVAVELSALWVARAPLRVLAAGLRKRDVVQLPG